MLLDECSSRDGGSCRSHISVDSGFNDDFLKKNTKEAHQISSASANSDEDTEVFV